MLFVPYLDCESLHFIIQYSFVKTEDVLKTCGGMCEHMGGTASAPLRNADLLSRMLNRIVDGVLGLCSSDLCGLEQNSPD